MSTQFDNNGDDFDKTEIELPNNSVSTGSFQTNFNVEPLKIGDEINGLFKLTQKIGEGGMGTVYKAIDLSSQEAGARNCFVAIKVLKPELSSDRQLFRLLHEELKKSKELVHKNIIQAGIFGRDPSIGCVYMTMEYLTGQTLSALIKEKTATYTLQTAWSIIEGIGHALSYAHKNNIVHRDIKPSNIFITNDGITKVLDFGISAKINEKKDDETQLPVVGYTIAYAAPEVLQEWKPASHDDVYSFGCVIYEMLTGRKYYDDKRFRGLTKPEPIKGLTTSQMRALTDSLGARSKGISVDYLLEELKPSKKSSDIFALFKNKYVVISLSTAIAIIIVTTVFLSFKDKEPVSTKTAEKSVALSVQSMTVDSGISNNDFYSNDNQPEFFGKADKNTPLTISLADLNNNQIAQKTMTTSSSGEWAINQNDAEPLQDGQYILTISASNGDKKFIKEQTITIDTIVPDINLNEINQQSLSKNDFVTTDHKFIFAGSSEPNATITATLSDVTNSMIVLEKSVVADSSWVIDGSDIEVPAGKYKLTITAEDNAGNKSTIPDKNIIIKNAANTTNPVAQSSPEISVRPTATLRLSKLSYHIGDKLAFYYTLSKPMYVKIVYRAMKGESAVLYSSNKLLKPEKTEFKFKPLVVQAPTGTDSITLIASEKPISNKIKFLNEDGSISPEIQNDDFVSTQISFDITK